jgi:hypothetical protein
MSPDTFVRPFALFAAALVPALALAKGEPLAPSDFAWGRAVEAPTSDPLQTLLLDLAIYRGAVAPGLVDLRVFNGAGEVVPHAIRALVDPRAEQGDLVSVPLFRVPEGSALARRAERAESRTVRARDVAIEIASDGAIVRLGPEVAVGQEEPRRPSAYLIDLSQLQKLKKRVVGLEFELAAEPAEFVVPLRIEASDDLVHFEPIAVRGALARLDQAGHRIERNQVELPAARPRYLLVASDADGLPVEVAAVRARLASIVAVPERARERVAGTRVEGECCAFVFDLGGAIPIDLVQVDLPAANTVVEAQLASADQPDGPWLQHFSGVLYELERPDGTLRNAGIHVPPLGHRHFKLTVAEKGGGIGGGTPELEVAWYPEQLLFVARGAPPYALGYGRAQTENTRFDAQELIESAVPLDPEGQREVPRETARLGPVQAVGDPSVLEPRREPPSPRVLALWGVLVAAVAIVFALSVRLLRRVGPA